MPPLRKSTYAHKRRKVKIRQKFKLCQYFIQELIEEFINDRCFVTSAAISYYTAFSMTPMLVILLPFVGQYLTKQEIIDKVSEMVGEKGASVVKTLIENAVVQPDTTLATTISIIMILIGATTVFSVLHTALNEIWQVKTDHIKNYVYLIRQRLLAFLMLILTGTSMIASVIFHTIFQFFLDNFQYLFTTLPPIVVEQLSRIVSLVLFMLLFSLIFKVLSDAKIKWKYIWVGALLTSLLFMLGRTLISFYLARSGIASVYGAAGSLVVLMIWFYYSAAVMLLGAELIKVYTRYRGGIIQSYGEIPIQRVDDKDKNYLRNARRKQLLKSSKSK